MKVLWDWQKGNPYPTHPQQKKKIIFTQQFETSTTACCSIRQLLQVLTDTDETQPPCSLVKQRVQWLLYLNLRRTKAFEPSREVISQTTQSFDKIHRCSAKTIPFWFNTGPKSAILKETNTLQLCRHTCMFLLGLDDNYGGIQATLNTLWPLGLPCLWACKFGK